jgi:hypothetical protein
LHRGFALALVLILAVSSPIIVESANAQSIPKPSVPEFTLTLSDHSYDVPTTYSRDPYTGQNITHYGFRVENKTLDVSIKNQPFTTYKDAIGNYTSLYYTLRFKGHFGDEWTYYPYSTNVVRYSNQPIYPASNSAYTIISLPLNSYPLQNIPRNAQVDFQVQALIGSNYIDYSLNYIQYYFIGESSDWSNTQTITIGETSASTSPNPTPTSTQNPTPTPTVPEFSWLAILPLCVSMLFVAVYLKHRRTNHE